MSSSVNRQIVCLLLCQSTLHASQCYLNLRANQRLPLVTLCPPPLPQIKQTNFFTAKYEFSSSKAVNCYFLCSVGKQIMVNSTVYQINPFVNKFLNWHTVYNQKCFLICSFKKTSLLNPFTYPSKIILFTSQWFWSVALFYKFGTNFNVFFSNRPQPAFSCNNFKKAQF